MPPSVIADNIFWVVTISFVSAECSASVAAGAMLSPFPAFFSFVLLSVCRRVYTVPNDRNLAYPVPVDPRRRYRYRHRYRYRYRYRYRDRDRDRKRGKESQ